MAQLLKNYPPPAAGEPPGPAAAGAAESESEGSSDDSSPTDSGSLDNQSETDSEVGPRAKSRKKKHAGKQKRTRVFGGWVQEESTKGVWINVHKHKPKAAKKAKTKPPAGTWTRSELVAFEEAAAHESNRIELGLIEGKSQKALLDRIPLHIRQAQGLPEDTDDLAVLAANARANQAGIAESVKQTRLAWIRAMLGIDATKGKGARRRLATSAEAEVAKMKRQKGQRASAAQDDARVAALTSWEPGAAQVAANTLRQMLGAIANPGITNLAAAQQAAASFPEPVIDAFGLRGAMRTMATATTLPPNAALRNVLSLWANVAAQVEDLAEAQQEPARSSGGA